MPGLTVRYGALAAMTVVLTLEAPAIGAQQQIQVVVTAVPNPVPAGSCTGIWVEVRNESNQRIYQLPDGTPLDSRSYDYSQPNAVDFAWKNDDPAYGYLCARPTAGLVSTVVTATIRGTPFSGTTVVAIQAAGAAPGAVASAGQPVPPTGNPQLTPPAATPTPSPAISPAGPGQPPQPPSAGAPPSGSGQPAVAPTAANTSGQPQPPASAAAAPGQPYVPQPSAAPAPPAQAYVPPTSPSVPPSSAAPAPVPAAPVAAAAPAPNAAAPAAVAPAEAKPEKGVGGFFKKIGKHIKEKAGEVTNQTAENLASSANQVVDATAQTGSNLVSGAAAGVSSAAESKVSGVGASLLPSALKGGAPADNLSTAVASGYAELRMLRFVSNTSILDAKGRDLVNRLAAVLKTTPGNFVIQAHVDPLPSPADAGASQELSEQRAGKVKDELIKYGVEAQRLTALGYGTSQPKPEVPPEGGSPSSARIVIAKTQ